MDPELKEYLEKQFDQVRTEARQTRSVIEGRLDNVETEARQTRSAIEGRFDNVETEARQARSAIEGRFDNVETEARQTRVLVEGLQGQVQLVAEGVVACNERLDRFQEEVRKEFKDLRAIMHLPYPPLDRRVTSLEGRVKKLEDARPPRKRAPTSRASAK